MCARVEGPASRSPSCLSIFCCRSEEVEYNDEGEDDEAHRVDDDHQGRVQALFGGHAGPAHARTSVYTIKIGDEGSGEGKVSRRQHSEAHTRVGDLRLACNVSACPCSLPLSACSIFCSSNLCSQLIFIMSSMVYFYVVPSCVATLPRGHSPLPPSLVTLCSILGNIPIS